MRPRIISNALGALLTAGGAAMLLPAAFSILSADGNVAAFGLPALGALALGALASTSLPEFAAPTFRGGTCSS